MLAETPAYDVSIRLMNGQTPAETARWSSHFFGIPHSEAEKFVHEIQQLINQQSIPVIKKGEVSKPVIHEPDSLKSFSVKFYSVKENLFRVDYETEQLEYMIHPKFALLETKPENKFNHHFQVFKNCENYILKINGNIIGQWHPDDDNYFTGKFSMELVNRMYGKTEQEWMAVFHASAIRKGQHSILFLGDSGSGKSTVAALLMANGYSLLADDFVPVDAASGDVYFFPAAVSVKKTALGHIIPLYPQLASASEFYYPGMHKTIRYLPPPQHPEAGTESVPCKALVFIKYQKDSGLKLEKLPKNKAFEKLVPDSWISPLPENAARFLDWFIEMPCYRLTYSDNEKMVKTVEKLFHK